MNDSHPESGPASGPVHGDFVQIRPSGDPDPAAKRRSLDLDAIRRKLESAKGPQYWSSLEELANTEEFQRFIEDEFPDRHPDWNNPNSRRTFLKLMGASLALAGAAACTKQPAEAIVPYVRQPEDLVPGKPLFYATAMPFPGGAVGVLAESHLGRPTKIEGNPTHPVSLGATDHYTQASVLDLYDPDRLQTVLRNGNISSWLNFVTALNAARDESGLKRGDGFRILTGSITSPTLAAQFRAFLAAFPAAKWHVWEPTAPLVSYNPVYNLANADVIVSLDSDFLCHGGAGLRYSRDFSDRRRITSAETPAEQRAVLENRPKEDVPEGHGPGSRTPAQGTPANLNLNRLYVFEGTPSLTGSVADHRFRVKTSEVAAVASALAGAVGAGGAGSGGSVPQSVAGAIGAVAKDLQAHRGRCVVIAGPYQPPAVHAAAHAMNTALGAVGSTVTYSAPVDINPVNGADSLRQLVADMNGGRVQTLLMLGGNPVYDAPADFGFLEALKKVKMRMHVTLFANETSRNCHWAVPEAHYLESWGDARVARRDRHHHSAADRSAVWRQNAGGDPRRAEWKGGRGAAHRRPGLLADAAGHHGFRRVVAALAERRCGGHCGRPIQRHSGFQRRSGAPAAARCHGDCLPARPWAVRRPFCEQRLVAGDAEAADPHDMGQCGAAQSADRAAVERGERQPHRNLVRGEQGHRSRLGFAGPRRRVRHGHAGLRAELCGPRWK